MKTLRSIIVAFAVVFNAINAMAEEPAFKTGKNASPEIKKEQKFEMIYDTLSQAVYVDIEGEFQELSSVSLANNRGSDILFNFIEGSEGKYEFDVSNLKSGSYFIILNTGEEIRMKRFDKE